MTVTEKAKSADRAAKLVALTIPRQMMGRNLRIGLGQQMGGQSVTSALRNSMTDEVFLMAWADLMDLVKRQRSIQREKTIAMFRDGDHAREVWDDWDGMSSESPNGEDAHLYLNIIGDGAYCAV